ncbi:MAG: HPP family protein [Desulfobulbaceae bacterium]|nr:HPP family protein [Desulfobulbaceae bacterium]
MPASAKNSTPFTDCLISACWAWLGGVIGIGLLAYIHYRWLGGQIPFLIGSFGASAVLVYGAIDSPLAQPRNLIGGHLISALVGVSAAQLAAWLPGDINWLAAALAVATAIFLMQITGALHPPGGATALIAVVGGDAVTRLGYWYVLMPVMAGAAILLIVALIVNNIPKNRAYPKTWW